MTRHSMFIGSSSEGLAVAQALQLELEHDVDVTIWSQGVFGLSEGTLEALEARIRDFDFASLVLTSDDLLMTRGRSGNTPRDNVVFGAGLCMGALGRRRVFLVMCRDDDIDLPSDLAGVTMATYNRRSDGNLVAGVGPVATRIRLAIAAVNTADAGEGARDSPEAPDGKAAEFSRLLTSIEQLDERFAGMSQGPLRGDHARLYATVLSQAKAARPDDALLDALSAPEETAMGGIYRTTVAEARTGLGVMRSALISEPQELPGEFRSRVVDTSLQLIEGSPQAETTGELVASTLGCNPQDSAVYHAFMEAHRRGELLCDFPGGMQLPYRVRRP